MSIGKYCPRTFRSVRPEETAQAAAQRMQEEGVGCLVVTDQSRPVGVVTDRDLALKVLREDLDAGGLPVRQVMQSPVVTIAADASLGEGVKKLRSSALRRLVVVDDKKEAVGVFAADDLLRLVATELGDLGEALRVQLSSEATAAPRGATEGRGHA
jgi:CBS domain-containing protein